MFKPEPDSKPVKQRALPTLLKHKSWSPDTLREEVWRRRKLRRHSRSLTDEDFDELKACIELGFGFDSPDLESDHRLSDTLPALGFYVAVNKSYNNTVSRMSSSSSLDTTSSSASSSQTDLLSLGSPVGSPLTIFTPGDDPKAVKTRLRQWAQAVACAVKQS
ncbi:uncharacterized protein LOC141623189 [Silene latifolia]|uniref:uncharacterized protein LOC141623189 n=1 Tax=Silene latifolia TaxID=37657 RepID=UPI003D7771F1